MEKKITIRDRYHNREQESYKQQLAKLIDKLSNTDGDLAATLIEKRIRQIADKITYTDKLPKSIDEMLKDASDVRKSRLLTKK